MTTLADDAALPGPRSSVAARRAVVRWAWRMFRREWRQQLLVLTLLAVAVTAAVASITIVNQIGAADDPDLGSANTALNFDASDPHKLEAGLAAARRSFRTIDVTAHRSVAVPGSVDTVDYRAEDPNGPYVDELLALRRGSYPSGPDEVAVSDGVAELLRLQLGSTLALDSRRRTVVGIVENPRKLSDEFALVSPSSLLRADVVRVLVNSNEEALDAFFGRGDDDPPAFAGAQRLGDDHPETKPLAMMSVATVFLLLASLVAAAGFAVVAQRRLRHLGMLAAVGATEKQLRLVLVANGAVVGALAALLGTIAGLAAWLVFAPTLESALDHRVDRLDLPWWLLATTVALAVVGATAAAWWPGRAASRLPVVLALSGRPPKPRPARHAAIAAIALISIGSGCLAFSDRDRTLLIVTGILATTLGSLLLGPLAIRIFARAAGRLPIAPRLALRDLVRYQARSGAALAAVTLALGIAATVVVIASAEEAEAANQPINLTDRQIRVYLGPSEARELTPVNAFDRIGALTAGVRAIVGQINGATVVPLRKPYEPGATGPVIGDTPTYAPVDLTRRDGPRHFERAGELFVATPALLRYLGIDPNTVDPGTEFVVDAGVSTRGLLIPSFGKRGVVEVTNVNRVETGGRLLGSPHGQDSAGQSIAFVTADGLRRNGWKTVPAGWMIEASRPLTADELADARELASNAGLTIEVQRGDTSNSRIMAIAIGAGAGLALAILALTVGLIRAEAAGDLRTLTATGAGSRIRRTLTATTAGALALLGALLGVAGAYAILAATYHDDLGYLSAVPFVYLGLAVLGVPLIAATAGWIVAGREPPALARPVID